jgi:hypothetical protein
MGLGQRLHANRRGGRGYTCWHTAPQMRLDSLNHFFAPPLFSLRMDKILTTTHRKGA